MPRKATTIPGPSRLSAILSDLKSKPQLELPNVCRLKIKLAARNDHFGARHFVKEELPRIRYANPSLGIEIEKIPKSKGDTWGPVMLLEFGEGKQKKVDMESKWSTAILKELMEQAGGTPWTIWTKEAADLGIQAIRVRDGKLASPKLPRATWNAFRKPVAKTETNAVDVTPTEVDENGASALLTALHAAGDTNLDRPRPIAGPGAVLP